MNVYSLRVVYKKKPEIFCEIEILGVHTLDDLHTVISHVFGFESEHLYSFFMNGVLWDMEKEYCSPDLDGRHGDGVCLDDLELEEGISFLYLMDYEMGHQFEIKVDKLQYKELVNEDDFPKLGEIQGNLMKYLEENPMDVV